MKKLLFCLIMLALVVPPSNARKPKDKAGKVKDHIYTDKKYNFKLSLKKDWKYSIRKNKDNFRIVLLKKNYEIPPDYIDAPDYTMTPRIILWTDTTTMSPMSFIDSLIKPKHKSKQKKEILKEFEILNDNISEKGNTREKLVTRKKKAIKISGNKALIWTGQMKYRKDVATSSSSIGGKRVIGAYGGSIIAIKKDDRIYIFQMICEWNYFETNLAITMEIVSSITWD